jgi:hypothetical protein
LRQWLEASCIAKDDTFQPLNQIALLVRFGVIGKAIASARMLGRASIRCAKENQQANEAKGQLPDCEELDD